MHETLCFPYKVRPRTSMIYLCGATVARRSRVWSDHGRITWSDHVRIMVGSVPHCKWGCKWCWWMSCRWSFEGSLARNAFLRDSRCTKPFVFPYKVRPQTWMIYLCGATVARRSRVWSDHGRIMFGSWSDRFRIVNGVARCWWMSCRWSFEGSLARNAFLRDSRCTKPYVFPYKVRLRTSMIYLCGATVARRSRVWSDHVRIMVGSCSDHVRIMVGSVPHCKWRFTCFSCMCGRQNSIVSCNCRIVPAMQMGLQVVLVDELPMEF